MEHQELEKELKPKFLIEKYNIPQISTGDILRATIADKTDMGMEKKKFMDAGQLVPDSTILELSKIDLQNLIVKMDLFLMVSQELWLKLRL